MADEFFIFSLRWTKEDYATWWCPNNSGYTSVISNAGRYARELVEAKPDYYNNGITTIAIPCDEVEKVAQLVVFDYAFRKLVAPRVLGQSTLEDDDDLDECPHCGVTPAPTSIGLRVIGVARG